MSPVDEHVKKQVISDSIGMMLRARAKGGVEKIGDRYRHLTRVFPG